MINQVSFSKKADPGKNLIESFPCVTLIITWYPVASTIKYGDCKLTPLQMSNKSLMIVNFDTSYG
jgi:hypothetical protein